MEDAIIVFREVNKFFGPSHVLKNINLSVSRGEVVVVCGPSGSGKSTLIRCINRLETIQTGELIVDGRNINADGIDLPKFRAQIGMVFQQFNLYPHKSALENITLAPIHVRKLSKHRAELEAMSLLEKVGIPEKAHAYPSQLSGGQQQRVAIARSLAMDPKIMLFDEPTSALDPEMIQEVLEVMTALAREGMTMIVVTHEMAFARIVANRIMFMDDGQIVEQASPDEFFVSPKSERAQSFLSKILVHSSPNTASVAL